MSYLFLLVEISNVLSNVELGNCCLVHVLFQSLIKNMIIMMMIMIIIMMILIIILMIVIIIIMIMIIMMMIMIINTLYSVQCRATSVANTNCLKWFEMAHGHLKSSYRSRIYIRMMIMISYCYDDIDDQFYDDLDDQFYDNQLQLQGLLRLSAVLYSQSYDVLMVFLIPSTQEHGMYPVQPWRLVLLPRITGCNKFNHVALFNFYPETQNVPSTTVVL